MKKGFKRPPFSKEWIEKIRKASIGRIHTEAWKKEMSKKNKGEKSPLWKGNKISNYNALHFWVRKEFGKPKECETCKTKEAKIYDWANISGEYKRDRSDWIRLCRACHIKLDKEENNTNKRLKPQPYIKKVRINKE